MGTPRSLGEGGYASEGSARRSVWKGATAVRPLGSTANVEPNGQPVASSSAPVGRNPSYPAFDHSEFVCRVEARTHFRRRRISLRLSRSFGGLNPKGIVRV